MSFPLFLLLFSFSFFLVIISTLSGKCGRLDTNCVHDVSGNRTNDWIRIEKHYRIVLHSLRIFVVSLANHVQAREKERKKEGKKKSFRIFDAVRDLTQSKLTEQAFCCCC